MFEAFRSRNYTLFWFGSFASNVGTWMQSTALGWLIYDMTRSASWLGIVSFAGQAPSLFLGLLGGAVADRTDHKRVLIGTQAVAGTTALVLAVLTATGALHIGQILALALFSGTALALYMPVVQAMIPTLVPAEELLNAVSLNSVQFNLARILGPMLAGLAYGTIGAAGCFFTNALSFFLLFVALGRLELPARPTSVPRSIWRQVGEGLGYARSEPVIVAMLLLASSVSLFGFPYIILMPAVARDVLHLGPRGLGAMMGSIGLGAVVGGLTLASVGDVQRKALLALGAASAFAVLLVVFSLLRSPWSASAVLVLVGMVQVTCIASTNTTLQVTVTDAMRGRVMSMLTLSLFGLSTLGSVLLGLIGDVIGVDGALRAGGFIILAVVALLLTRAREVFSRTQPAAVRSVPLAPA